MKAKTTIRFVKLATEIEIQNLPEEDESGTPFMIGGTKRTLTTNLATDKGLSDRGVIWQVIDEDAMPAAADEVKLYDRVPLWLPEDEEKMEIRIVSTVRIKPDAGFISMESPLGRAVLGKKVGQTVHVSVDDGYSYDVEIRAVEQADDDGTAPLMPY